MRWWWQTVSHTTGDGVPGRIPDCTCVPEEAPDRVCGPEQMVASCREGCKLLQAFVDRELDEDTARVIAAHLDDCRRCGLEAEMYRRVQDSLRTRVSVSQAAVARLQEFAYALEDGRAPSDAE